MEHLMKLVVFVALVVGAQSALDKTLMVKWHNDYRATITDSASTFQTIAWKDSLATIAQDWADECTQTHNANRKTQAQSYSDILKKNVGENIAWGSGNVNLESLVTLWWNENQYFDASTNTCESGKVCGHYKQMAWAKTYAIGCGYASCSFGGYLVCNYEPGVYGTNPPYTYQAP